MADYIKNIFNHICFCAKKYVFNKLFFFLRIIDGGLIEQNGLIDLGDIIVEIGGAPIHTPDDLMYHVSSFLYIYFVGTGTACKGQLEDKKFKLNSSWSPGSDFLSYCNHQFIKFEQDKRFGV